MNIKKREEIIKDWEKDNFENIYLFIGEDFFLKEEVIEHLKRKFSKGSFDFFTFYGDEIDINSFLMDCLTPPLTFNKRIIVLKKAHKIKSSAFEKLIDYIKSPSPSTSLIIFYDKELKPKDLLYVEFIELKCVLCNFSQMNIQELRDYINKKFLKRNKSISIDNIDLLISLTDNNSAIISSEIDKLCFYVKDRKEITHKDILESTGGIKSENPFDVINFIMARDKDNLIKLIDNLLLEKNEPLWIIALIINALEKILKIIIIDKNELWGDNKLLYSLGIYRSDIYKSGKFKNIDERKILNLLNKCIEAEYLLKTSSDRNPEMLIKNLIYSITAI